RLSLRSAYSRTRSGTSAFLPLTIVLTQTPQGWLMLRVSGSGAGGRAAALPVSSIPSSPGGPDSALASDGDRRDCQGPGAFESESAGRERGAGRHDVVDQQDPTSGHRARHLRRIASADPKRAVHVRRPLVAPQLELGDRRSLAFEGTDDGQPQPLSGDLGDERCLVVAASALA